MTDLPDNHEAWPTNPYELLSIEQSVGERTARRAYFKLVKKYKPDAAPNEFQKIRRAYEQVKTQLGWRTKRDTLNDNSDGDDNTISAVQKNAEPALSSQNNFTTADTAVDPFARFHQLLKLGELTAAEEALHQIKYVAGTTQSVQANFSKYYLSRFKQWQNKSAISPQSSPTVSLADSDRIDWLLNIFNSAPHYHFFALERLKEEFDSFPELANCTVFNGFLSQLQNQQVMQQLYALRWQAIGGQDWHSVIEDVSAIKSCLSEFGNTYHYLLAESMKYTVWYSDDRCLVHNKECWEELYCQDGWLADSTEVLMMAAEQWKAAPADFPYTQEIPRANCSLPNTAHQIWAPVASSLAQNRKAALFDLDGYYRKHSLMMSVFAQGLTTLADQTGPSVGQPNWESVTKLVARFFNRHQFADYRSARIPILNFCIDNQISPSKIGQQTSQFLKDPETPTWYRIIQNDGPLQCIFNACRSISY